MATFRVTDPETGQTIRLTGDSPPSEQELEQIFASQRQTIDTQRQEEPGFFDFFTGASRQTPETESLPELQSLTTPVTTGAFDRDMRIAAGLMSSLNEKDQLDVIRAADPDATIRRDEKGNAIVRLGSGQEALLNRPGASTADALQMTAQVMSFLPAARLANFGRTLLTKAGIGALGAGTTQAALQEASTALGAEDARRPGEVATAAALGGVAEVVLPAVQAVRGARMAKGATGGEPIAQVAGAVDEATAAQRGLAQATGREVPLFQAQQTTVPAALEKQAFIAQLPAGTQKASTALQSQNRAVSGAVNDFLNMIAPPESIVTSGQRFRTASQRALENAKRIRSERTSPIYNQAFASGDNVNLDPVRTVINESLGNFPEGGQIFKIIKRVESLIKPTKDGTQPSLRKLHGAKLEIDELLNKVGPDSLGNTSKRELTKIKDSLVSQMSESSPLYRQALDDFARQSPPVNQLQDSIIGNIANMDDTQLKSISRRIFDPAETNPVVIRNAKKVIDDVDPDAWNELFRTELERRMGTVAADLTGETIENIPGQLRRAIFGNKKNRDVLFNSVDGEMKKNLQYLETVLKRASLGRPGGSQTAAREEIKRELRGGVFQSIRNFFRNPISSTASVGEDIAFNNRVRKMADVFFDPQWKSQMARIRKLDPNSPAAARAMAQLLNDISPEEQEQ